MNLSNIIYIQSYSFFIVNLFHLSNLKIMFILMLFYSNCISINTRLFHTWYKLYFCSINSYDFILLYFNILSYLREFTYLL